MNISSRRTHRRWRAVFAIVAASTLIGACAESTREAATGKGRVRGINAVVTAPELVFLNEERAQSSITYRAISGFTEWDDLTYNFNFDVILPGEAEPTRLATQVVDVQTDFEHTIVLTGTLSNPSFMFWEVEEREFDGTETVFEIDFFNASPLLGQVDIYYAIEGTAPVVGNEVGTIAFGERIPYIELQEGSYELIVTAPGDPATVIFTSTGLDRLPAERVTIGLFDTDPSITAAVGVNLIFDGGAAQGLSDVNSPPELRLSHASFGVGNIDGYLNDDFGTIVFPDVAFGQLSPYAVVDDTEVPLDITPVGDPATILAEAEIQRINNSRRTAVFWGLPGAHLARVLDDSARPLELFPVLRITHLAANVDDVDFYIVDPGTVLDETVFPDFFGGIPGISTGFFNTTEGMREIIATETGETTPISNPFTIDIANGDVIDLVLGDTADPAVVEFRLLDSIP